MVLRLFQFVSVLVESTLAVSDSIHGKFVRHETGIHPHLSGHILRQITTRSKLECGILCQQTLCMNVSLGIKLSGTCDRYNNYNKKESLFGVPCPKTDFPENDVTNCDSLRFNAATRECIEYGAFMSYTSLVDEVFYTVPGVQDAAALICPTPRTYNSSVVNVAQGKDVTMSSQYQQQSPARLAVDGSLNNAWPCAGTLHTYQPYLRVDLGHIFNLFSIYILNRGDCCAYRLHHLKVQIGKTMTSLQDVFYQESAIGCDVTIFLPQLTHARYVNLVIEETEKLTVCELEVYAIM